MKRTVKDALVNGILPQRKKIYLENNNNMKERIPMITGKRRKQIWNSMKALS